MAGRDRPCGRPPAEHIETSSDAVNPGAPCRAARPCPQAEQIAKPTERDARLAGFFVFPAIGRLVPFQLFEPSRRKRILAEGPGARVSASLADQVGTALGRRRLVLDAHPLPVSAPHVEVSDETAHFIRACLSVCLRPATSRSQNRRLRISQPEAASRVPHITAAAAIHVASSHFSRPCIPCCTIRRTTITT